MQNATPDGQSAAVASENDFLVTTVRPARPQLTIATAIIVGFVGASIMAAPHARLPLPGTEALLPAYAAAVALVEFLTFVLLLSIFRIERSASVLILALGYLFSATLVVPWALTFPGVFPSLGLGTNLQSTAFIAAARRLSFPLFALAYALSKDRPSQPLASRRVAPAGVAGVLAGAIAVTAWALRDAEQLPDLMTDARMASPLWNYVPLLSISLYVLVVATLWARRRSVLDLWLMVVISTLAIEFVLLAYVSAGIRLTIGWWVGRCFGLASASLVLIVLLTETAALYAGLTRTLVSERRGRDGRLIALEAFSALVAHEINQPLASITTNGQAGLRWIGRREPDVAEARAAFERIVSDGHRAADILRSIRSMVQTDIPERVPVNLNRLVEDVVTRGRAEALLDRISVEVALTDDLPAVIGDPIQLRLVVENLFSNAIDAMHASSDRPRLMRIATGITEDGLVRFELADNGIGVEPAQAARIFEPFFTTKTGGMGLGLMFCRHVVEAHGGRLWCQPNEPHGAIFRFTLPRAEQPPVAAPARRNRDR
ncbi:sensor histidine kinase [Mangrovicella endophytica]|uniref:sensor histidine kinase n=1 Tax=Mangrovicella endophytica TaxID=2066697 RepID=UPI000C9EA884|nr:ATP-binding protein [Mangrovicella endophytica]